MAHFESNAATVPAVKGTNTSTPTSGVEGPSVGVEGQSDHGFGVYGHSISSRGVVAHSDTDYGLRSSSRALAGLRSSSEQGNGLEGWATTATGVVGIATTGTGVAGLTDGTGTGVLGTGKTGNGVHGTSEAGFGVLGESISGRGVVASSDTNYGLRAASRTLAGIRGSSADGNGVEGWATEATGIVGISVTGEGVFGVSEHGIGVHGKGATLAGLFEGDVKVAGHLFCTDVHCPNADCAEDFDIADPGQAEPGTVMVLGSEGALYKSVRSYDKRVAGVVSGAGRFKPAIVLDQQPGTSANRKAIALLGKTYCKVDASLAPIEVGDLLTTSEYPGHAMKAVDPLRAFGAVIGKALLPLAEGRGLIPILIALQ